jgi:hypothetical protein
VTLNLDRPSLARRQAHGFCDRNKFVHESEDRGALLADEEESEGGLPGEAGGAGDPTAGFFFQGMSRGGGALSGGLG